MKHKVFKASQNAYIEVLETETEEEAREFCESHNWELKDENEYIYISHKNYYINVSFIEKTVLKNDKKIKFKNKNAIIQ